MKIEFIEETKLDGTKRYFTNIDGKYADGTCDSDKNRALEFFNNIVSYQTKNKLHTLESQKTLNFVEL